MTATHKISARTVEIFVGMLATAMIAAGLLLYALQEPDRIQAAQAAQLSVDLDEAMSLYAENCSVCHGRQGEGIGATPPLDNLALRQSDPQALAKIIARGLYGTAMPAWHQEDGGPLSDYQVDQMVLLVQFGDWNATRARVADLGMLPSLPFTAQPDPATLEAINSLPDGAQIAQGVSLFAEQCVACHGADGLGTALAPALNDPIVRQKAPEELQRTILYGVPGTLMAAWDKSLTTEDIAALVTLLTRWGSVPAGAIPAPNTPTVVTEESLALGEEYYTANCSRCHAPEGQGSQRAPALNVKAFLSQTSDLAMQQIITLGVPGTAMPAWGDRLADEQIQAIVGYLRSWEPDAPEVAIPVRIRGPWWQQSSSAAPILPSGGTNPQGSHPSTPTQTQPSPIAWFEDLDSRAVLIISIFLTISLGLIGLALMGINRLPKPPYPTK